MLSFCYSVMIFASGKILVKGVCFFFSFLWNSEHSWRVDFDYLFIKPSVLELFTVTINNTDDEQAKWKRTARNWGKEIENFSLKLNQSMINLTWCFQLLEFFCYSNENTWIFQMNKLKKMQTLCWYLSDTKKRIVLGHQFQHIKWNTFDIVYFFSSTDEPKL